MHDRNQALWGGYVIESGDVRVHFAGDTGYGPHFGYIKERISNLDLSLLPIGAYEPRWFMGEQHMNPDDAVRAHIDLNTKISLAMHHSCIQLTDEGIDDPLKELTRARLAHGVTESQFLAPATGETVLYKQGKVISELTPPD